MKVLTGAKVLPESVRVEEGRVVLQVDKGGEKLPLEAERMLVSVGREPNTEDIGLQNTSIQLEREWIQ